MGPIIMQKGILDFRSNLVVYEDDKFSIGDAKQQMTYRFC